MAVNIDTMTTSWHICNKGLVVVHGWWYIFVGVVVDVTAQANLILWHWSAEVTASLLVSLLVGSNDEVVVVHDWMPEGEFHITQQVEDSVELLLRNPVSLE